MSSLSIADAIVFSGSQTALPPNLGGGQWSHDVGDLTGSWTLQSWISTPSAIATATAARGSQTSRSVSPVVISAGMRRQSFHRKGHNRLSVVVRRPEKRAPFAPASAKTLGSARSHMPAATAVLGTHPILGRPNAARAYRNRS